jgi:hypothetical protein
MVAIRDDGSLTLNECQTLVNAFSVLAMHYKTHNGKELIAIEHILVTKFGVEEFQYLWNCYDDNNICGVGKTHRVNICY